MQRHAIFLARAFTLIEVGVAMVLLSLLIAVAVPGLSALSGARLREAASVVGGLVRDTYARTALLGRSTRVVFDLEKNAYWVEEAPSVARVKRDRIEADRDGVFALEKKDDRLDGIEADTDNEEERAKLEILGGSLFVAIEGDNGKPQPLPSDVRFKSAWVEHVEDRAQKGAVALYFFPGGFTEEAQITLTDDEEGERTLTVVVSSLTGDVEIVSEEPRLPDVEDDV